MGGKPGGVIAAVAPESLADQAGLKPGDELITINGHSLRDIIDVQFYGSDEMFELVVVRDGHEWQIELSRDYDEELGLSFVHPTFDVDIRRCANNCDFCFVKQNAPGMRRSLYIKDDDYRYSFLFGNFVTLTNLTDDDWARLEEQRLSPLYISVHSTDPTLRRRFLSRKNAPDVVKQLRRLDGLGIEVHTQVVLVPGLNDGENLMQTMATLTGLYRKPVASVSIVPVGLTKYHRGGCRTYTPEESGAILDQALVWREENREKLGCALVHPSDEWYLVAEREVPPAQEYDGFPQVENGVGMVRRLLDEWNSLSSELAGASLKPATIVCGSLIAPVMARIVREAITLTGTDWELVPVANQFFGPVTTVSGLLTGQDVMAALRQRNLGDVVLLPRAMFTGQYGAGSALPGTTLDDISIVDISAQLGVRTEMAGTVTEALAVLT